MSLSLLLKSVIISFNCRKIDFSPGSSFYVPHKKIYLYQNRNEYNITSENIKGRNMIYISIWLESIHIGPCDTSHISGPHFDKM